jgi:uncharacterized protein (TIGR00290 family)
LSWSSGKDCAWALHVLRQQAEVEVVGLLTTFNQAANRVAMHAVRRQLVQEQTRLAGLPLRAFDLPWPCSNDEYQKIMAGAWQLAVSEGVECVAFGDLFLEDVRNYRIEQLKPTGLEPLFPIWGIPTNELAEQMVRGGLAAKITCVDPKQLDKDYVGREWSEAKKSFPTGVDVCGERGEFHTFTYAGPMFSRAMSVETGEIVERDGFVFADLKLSAEQVSIRKAEWRDSAAICELSEQLGYPSSGSDVETRVRNLADAALNCILVAEVEDAVVGWIDIGIVSHLVSGTYGEIGGMVVTAGKRGQGIGRLLLSEAEDWLRSRGVKRSVVRSRITRADTHRFYQREGFALEKTSAVFHKTLD